MSPRSAVLAIAALLAVLAMGTPAAAGKRAAELSPNAWTLGGPARLVGPMPDVAIWQQLEGPVAFLVCLTGLNTGRVPVTGWLGPLATGVRVVFDAGGSRTVCRRNLQEIWIEACPEKCSLAWRVDQGF